MSPVNKTVYRKESLITPYEIYLKTLTRSFKAARLLLEESPLVIVNF